MGNLLMSKRYLYFTIFSSGLTVLALELSAPRLLGRTFGTSNLVYSSIIGLILIFLTVGYFTGGRWADRSPHPQTMYRILAWGAFFAGLIPAISTPVLRMAADAFDQLNLAILFGSFSAVLILFSVPITLLGMISPFAIRLAIQDPLQAGKVAGTIYAISTLGSFLGTFLPSLVFIDLIGTALTFISFSFFLVCVGLVGLWLAAGWRSALRLVWMLGVLIGLAFVVRSSPLKNTPGQIYETESSYNYIQVLEQDGYHLLRLNEGQGVHSVWHATILDYEGPWEQFLAAPFFNKAPYDLENITSMAIIGLAGGTVARQATAVFGPIEIDGFEIDPKIIKVGQEFFGMTTPNLNAIAQDGRWGLEHSYAADRSPKRYSVVAVDAYRPPYIPWHLTTSEFFQIVHDHLTEEGVMVINVGRSPTDRRLVDGLVGTIGTIFPSIYVMDLPLSFNSIIYATVQPTKIENLYANLLDLYTHPEVNPLLIASIERVVVNQQPAPHSEVVFTDDLSPIEWITNHMVLSYVLFGDMEALSGPQGP